MTTHDKAAKARAYKLGRTACRKGIASPYEGWNLPELEAEFNRGYVDEQKAMRSAT